MTVQHAPPPIGAAQGLSFLWSASRGSFWLKMEAASLHKSLTANTYQAGCHGTTLDPPAAKNATPKGFSAANAGAIAASDRLKNEAYSNRQRLMGLRDASGRRSGAGLNSMCHPAPRSGSHPPPAPALPPECNRQHLHGNGCNCFVSEAHSLQASSTGLALVSAASSASYLALSASSCRSMSEASAIPLERSSRQIRVVLFVPSSGLGASNLGSRGSE